MSLEHLSQNIEDAARREHQLLSFARSARKKEEPSGRKKSAARNLRRDNDNTLPDIARAIKVRI